MDNSRNQNGREWHAGKPKKKPDYDAESVKQELLDAAVGIYGVKGNGGTGDGACDGKNKSLRAVSEELEAKGYGKLNPAKVKKILISAKAYSTPTTEKIQQLRSQGHSIEQIMSETGLSRAAVNNNLPYEKIVYKIDTVRAINGGAGGEVSVNADRVRLYKKRKSAVEKLLEDVNMENLWECIVAFEGYPFKTTSGLEFSYQFKLNRHGEKGNEIVVSRKEKSITRSSVERAFGSVMERGEIPAKMPFPVAMSTPKELGVFGASYIYPLFVRFGLVEHVGRGRRGGRKKG